MADLSLFSDPDWTNYIITLYSGSFDDLIFSDSLTSASRPKSREISQENREYLEQAVSNMSDIPRARSLMTPNPPLYQSVKLAEQPKNLKAIDRITQYINNTTESIIDVFKLSPADREQILRGDTIKIVGKDLEIIREDVSKCALALSCRKVSDLIQIKPKIATFRIYDTIDRTCIDTLLDAFTTGAGLQANALNLVSPNFETNILMYQACQYFGVVYHHTKSLYNALCAEISARLLTKEELSATVRCVREEDALFKHLANDLCYRRYKKRIPDLQAFEKWLGNRKALQSAMVEIDRGHKMRREVFREGKMKRGETE